MADDKKPKIDLKARLGKTAVPAPTPAPAPVAVSPSGRPAPRPLSIPAPARSQPPPGALPIPTPSPFAAGGMDRSNPLAAAMAPAYAQPQRQAARPPEPQRIEFDDLTVQQASRGGLKKGIVIGIVLALIFGGVGYTAGGAMEQRAGRDSSKAGAVDMANDATKARDQLKTLADKMEAGRKELLTDHKFPATLAHDLGAINVAFEGTELAGRRFSGFSTDTTRDLIAFVQSVDGINKHRGAIANLLTTLQKPITEQLAIPPGPDQDQLRRRRRARPGGQRRGLPEQASRSDRRDRPEHHPPRGVHIHRPRRRRQFEGSVLQERRHWHQGGGHLRRPEDVRHGVPDGAEQPGRAARPQDRGLHQRAEGRSGRGHEHRDRLEAWAHRAGRQADQGARQRRELTAAAGYAFVSGVSPAT